MFEWLEEELARIKTRKFHVVDGPASDNLRAAIEKAVLPDSYKNFVLRFGSAKLYRVGDYYKIGVYAPPAEGRSKKGELLLCFGHYDSARAYFKASLLRKASESPVFEWGSAGLRKVADGFKIWLKNRCLLARKSYGKKKWAEIVDAPPPFTDDERSIIDARRHYRWKVVGVSKAGNLIFEVRNESNRILPYLSIGIRSKDGHFHGGIWLPVSEIAPGEKAIIEKESYKGLVSASELEAFELPDPEPEDRERYWEFRSIVLGVNS